MELFTTNKGADACSFNGFTYRVSRVSVETGIKHWRCRNTCNGKLWTSLDNSNPKEVGGHNHPPDPEKMVVLNAISKMKTRSKNECTSITKIHSETAAQLSQNPSVSARFPTLRSVNASLYRSRRKCYTRQQSLTKSGDIPDNFCRTIDEDVMEENGETSCATLNSGDSFHSSIGDDDSSPSKLPSSSSSSSVNKPCTWVELVTHAIETSPKQQMTLSEIYDWMIDNGVVPEDQRNSPFTATWKSTIRSRLSKFKRFQRIGQKMSSSWTVDVSQKLKRNELREPWLGRRYGAGYNKKKKSLDINNASKSTVNVTLDSSSTLHSHETNEIAQKNDGFNYTNLNSAPTELYSLERRFSFFDSSPTSAAVSPLIKVEQSDGHCLNTNGPLQSLCDSTISVSPVNLCLSSESNFDHSLSESESGVNRLVNNNVSEETITYSNRCSNCEMNDQNIKEQENELLASLTKYTFQKIHPALRAKGKLLLQQILCHLEERSLELYNQSCINHASTTR